MLPIAVYAADHDYLIEARQQVDLSSPVEAVVESVQVQRGDSVKKGQIVATLESGPERAALELAKSRATMQGELKAAKDVKIAVRHAWLELWSRLHDSI